MTATPKKPAVKKAAAPKKPRVAAVKAHKEAAKPAHSAEQQEAKAPKHEAVKHDGKYFYAVGRRKTAVANVRLFFGKGKSQVNKREIESYFGRFSHEVTKPLQLTGLESQVYFYANVNGGGVHSQAQALAHGLARAIEVSTPDYHKVLKKNGQLTRDDRRKERKKPGLKRARRGPQWAKR